MKKMNLNLNLIILVISSLLLCTSFTLSFAQTATEKTTLPTTQQEIKKEMESTSIQADTNTLLTGTGIAGVIYTAARQFLDQKKNRKEDKGTDVDLTRVSAIIGKIFAYAYVIDPYWKKVLDSPVDANPLNADIKIGHEYAKEMQGLLDYTKTVINQPVPNMSIATNPQPSPIQKNEEVSQNPTEETKPVENPK